MVEIGREFDCIGFGGLRADKEIAPGPTVDAFNGRLVHDGKPVSFSDKEKVELKLVTEKAESFGVPIKPDGTFQIGWMPIGKYSATLQHCDVAGAKGSAPVMIATCQAD